MKELARALIVLSLALTAATCGGGSSSTTPTSPSTPAINETFSGTLSTGTIVNKTFQGGPGAFAIVLGSLTPAFSGGIGIGFGVWDGSSCTLAAVNDSTVVGGGLHGTITAASTKCVKIYDPGTIPPGFASDFKVLVSHY